MELKIQLQHIRKDSLLIHDFLAKVKSIADHLTIVGNKVPEIELIMYLLCGLRANYKGFVRFLNTIIVKPTLQKV